MNYWQIAAGGFGRDYAKDFFRFGMAFVGGSDQIATMETVEVGDRLLLKRGIKEIVAVGEVEEREERDGRRRHKGCCDKDWLISFRGWYLPAWCYVRWHILTEPRPVEGLLPGAIGHIYAEDLLRTAEEVINTVPARDWIDPEPGPTEEVTDDNIRAFLNDRCRASGLGCEFKGTCATVKRYWGDERSADFKRWKEIREHEARTFLVIPLLLALGWREEQIKIERPVRGRPGRMDVACFLKPFAGRGESPALIIETKALNKEWEEGLAQAKGYANAYPECRTVAATNGRCYLASTRDSNGDFPEKLSAYVDLMHLRNRDPLDPENVDGCLKMLELLMPPSDCSGGNGRVVDTPPPPPPSPPPGSYAAFYTDLLSRLKGRYPELRTKKKIRKDAHLLLPSGKGCITYAFAFRPSGRFETAIFMAGKQKDKDKVKGWFDALKRHSGEIERCFGHSLNWERLDRKIASRISIDRPGSPQLPPEELDNLKEWAIDMYGRFRDVFDDRIQDL